MTPIVHVVAWRLRGPGEADRQAQARTVLAALEATRGQVPGLLSLEAGANLVDHPDAWDLGAVLVFASQAALDAYQAHPAHLALKAVVGPLRSARSQLDFARRPAPSSTPAPGATETTP